MQGFQKALRVAVFNKKSFIVISVLRTVTNLMYDEIVIIENGRIALRGSFDEIKDSPKLKLYRNVR